MPGQWLGEAKSVISFFLPFTEQVKKSNGILKEEPSKEWLHARIEGQKFVMAVCRYIKELLEADGMQCVIPAERQQISQCNKVWARSGRSVAGQFVIQVTGQNDMWHIFAVLVLSVFRKG